MSDRLGWAPIWSMIVKSSLWTSGSKDARLMFVTMLALKDWEGFVSGTIPALAKDAGLTLEEGEKAIKELESPDKWSNNQKDKGRRIRKVSGGWVVLNHYKYRDMVQELKLERRRAYKAWHEQKRRDKAKQAGPVQELPKGKVSGTTGQSVPESVQGPG